ncbi:Lrp/AsnC family transcriptional regulator [Comamonas sp. MYb396]|uniref:Lrp/AsnC family transcriptional regulator n=1 Tax=Comamonas sp. MYb396 TaxID=2745302 RepID=UPI0030A08DDE
MTGKMLDYLDLVDHKIIAALRSNARTSIVSLSKEMGLARATVQNRIARLERDGVIVAYTLQLRSHAEPQGIRAIMSVEIVGNKANDVINILRGNPNVVALHSTNGRWDLMAEVRADDLEKFDRVLNEIRLIEGVGNSETSLLLTTYKL